MDAPYKTKTCFVTIQQMQSFNTNEADAATPDGTVQSLRVCAAGDLRPGACLRFELPAGGELAIYNVDGEYYATENSCPHRGAPLSDGDLRGHTIECGWHGWQFDVRTGECLTVPDRIRTVEVTVEDGMVRVVIGKT
jgi:nitrite reductase/ring-hydroxylating ferredoxin subunit